MLRILHRVNTLEALEAAPPEFGVEMDIHGYADQLVVHHEPGVCATAFEQWLDAYRHAFVILNVKEEGIERRVRDLVLARGIQAFFMLDLSFPALVKMVRTGERRVAIRVSEHEPAAGALSLAGRADWVWLDSFQGGLPIAPAEVHALEAGGFHICLVSPELHGRPVGEIADLQRALDAAGLSAAAVCTKYPERW